MKKCSRCKGEKPLAEFGRNKGYADGYDSWCLKCRRVYNREYRPKYYQENKEKLRGRSRAYQETQKIPCPDCSKPMCPTSNYCRPCSSHRVAQYPERKAISSRVMKDWWDNDPDGKKRRAASERSKKRWQDEEYRQKMKSHLNQQRKERTGQKMSEEFCQKVSDGLKRAYAEGRRTRYEETEESRHKRSESVKKLWRESHYDNMLSRINREPTNLELDLAWALDELGLIHTPQYRPNNCLYIYDEYVPTLGLFIEADGEHWHHSAWAKSQGVPEKDSRKDKWATENGYRIIHLRGRDIGDFGIKACLASHLFTQLEI